jgi:hypothetical protein
MHYEVVAQVMLQADYVKALYAALNTEKNLKLEEIMMIGNDSASSSSAGSGGSSDAALAF